MLSVHNNPAASAATPTVHYFRALGCGNEIQLHAGADGEAQRLAQLGIAETNRIEAKYTRYRDDSLTSRINRAAGQDWVEIDDETEALLDYADACHRQSGGMFDLTSGVLRRAWDFRRGVVPTGAEVAALLPLINWQLVERAPGRVRLARPGMELDFGGIGKEYCADRVATILQNAGARHCMVNLGGDIRVIGPHPNGAPWSIGIRHPRTETAILATVNLKQGALATSGDYERYFERYGKRYTHILNPRTGYPVATMRSVTVVAPLCTVAGSLCTLAMLQGERGADFLAKQEFPYLVADHLGRVYDALASP
jgi:thiamine biosynthesis lipoprotein